MLTLVLTAPAAILAFRAMRHWSRRLSNAARPWALGAGALLLAAAEVYMFGLVHLAGFLGDVRDVCISRYQNWNSAYGQISYWPLEGKCTAYIDMVPAYINPLVVVLLVTASMVALAALGRAISDAISRGGRDTPT